MACPLLRGFWLVYPRQNRVCTCCNTGALGDKLFLVLERPALAGFCEEYAALVPSDITTMHGFFSQQDHMGVFKYMMQCLDFMDT